MKPIVQRPISAGSLCDVTDITLLVFLFAKPHSAKWSLLTVCLRLLHQSSKNEAVWLQVEHDNNIWLGKGLIPFKKKNQNSYLM